MATMLNTNTNTNINRYMTYSRSVCWCWVRQAVRQCGVLALVSGVLSGRCSRVQSGQTDRHTERQSDRGAARPLLTLCPPRLFTTQVNMASRPWGTDRFFRGNWNSGSRLQVPATRWKTRWEPACHVRLLFHILTCVKYKRCLLLVRSKQQIKNKKH